MDLPDLPEPILTHPLHELIGVAVCDVEFRERLLSHPRKTAAEFGLEGNERRAAAAVTGAANLAEYAVKLEQRFAGIIHGGRVAVRRRKKKGKQSSTGSSRKAS